MCREREHAANARRVRNQRSDRLRHTKQRARRVLEHTDNVILDTGIVDTAANLEGVIPGNEHVDPVRWYASNAPQLGPRTESGPTCDGPTGTGRAEPDPPDQAGAGKRNHELDNTGELKVEDPAES